MYANISEYLGPWKEGKSAKSPKIWGPLYWANFHISSISYPKNPTPVIRERMKHRILAIPYELPCQICRIHASAYIDGKREDIEDIVSCRDSLFRFYVDFHNAVNARLGKPKWSYEQAYRHYSKAF